MIPRTSVPIFLALSALCVSLTSCAAKYGEYSRWNQTGYSTIRLAQNTFRVRFAGDIFTDRARVVDFALLQCADVALENGYPYFVVVDEKAIQNEFEYKTPERTSGSATVTGNTITGNTVKTGGQIFRMKEVQAENTIMCFKENPGGTTVLYDAQMISQSIRNKYNVTGRHYYLPTPSNAAGTKPEGTMSGFDQWRPSATTSTPQSNSPGLDAKVELQRPQDSGTNPDTLTWEKVSRCPLYIDIPANQIDTSVRRAIAAYLKVPEEGIIMIRLGKAMAPINHPHYGTTTLYIELRVNSNLSSQVIRFDSTGAVMNSE